MEFGRSGSMEVGTLCTMSTPWLAYALGALVAPAVALARATLYLNTGIVPTANPVEISLPDLNIVLSQHLGVEAQSLPLPCAERTQPEVWHHLPEDGALYDASSLFDSPAKGGIMVTFHGLEDEEALFGESLRATHVVPHGASGTNYDALAELYATVTNGVKDAAHHAGDALTRFHAELGALRRLADANVPINLDAVYQLRLSALADVRSEYGAKSHVFQEAKAQLQAVMERLTQRALAGAAPLALVHAASQGHARRGLETREALLAPFAASTTRLGGVVAPLNGSLPDAGACHLSKESLERATVKCSGHGSPIETSKGGKKCWRCACTPTKSAQRTLYWVRLLSNADWRRMREAGRIVAHAPHRQHRRCAVRVGGRHRRPPLQRRQPGAAGDAREHCAALVD